MAIIVIVVYEVVIYLIKMWKGCNRQEAEKIIHNFLSFQAPYHLNQDNFFFNECCQNIKAVLGEQRFKDLENFSMTTQTVDSGLMSNIPYIAFTLMYSDDNEKIRLESLLTATVKKYLKVHNLSDTVIASWGEHKVLNLPILYIYYAENDNQETLILNCIIHKNTQSQQKYQPLRDDEEVDISE